MEKVVIEGSVETVVVEEGEVVETINEVMDVLEIAAQGPPGPAGDLHYTHTQGVAAAMWSITHSLGKHPSITVIDSGGDEVIPAIAYPSPNAVTLTFSGAVSGVAYLN
ncbi:MAG: hypothetical protein JNJ94_13315 [Chlorobi bacterium]|nr:hypothetical protein [Chlorobiota bacterium]